MIDEILKNFQEGKTNFDEAKCQLENLLYKDLGFAKIDNLRQRNKGFAEVIYCKSKTIDQISCIVRTMNENGTKNILLSRISKEAADEIKKIDPDAEYSEIANMMVCFKEKQETSGGKILVVCAGTSDLPVAEEAVITAQAMGNEVERLYDVGVAGIHRLLKNTPKLREATVIIAVAGMEGALPSVIGGLTNRPIIAVPTSVGYGANFGGLSALLTMLNSCASGISVVNIDNGFGAGYQASLINNLLKEKNL